MRIILELKTDSLKKGDVVYYDGKQWVNKSKTAFLFEQQKEIEEMQKKYDELQEQFDTLKDGVNTKLKQFHDILQLQVNEGE